ncbi:AraC family transcriptional regulator [Paenibacillus alginolyticus]|uniref:AraC family transcriptional regulator n=1 Tax=Paenibacillus alginolyticus TaxID=59839 RepID=A0ABT4G5E7_9BACL|nr:AraC family transcriptional regulator [Paenibacillus alginolyticus]MCY9691409.1 AraC family transcriptional regulator [Paenibacillus alginolyticus]MEC0146517.1 AraC family transcriptional regulator [Paenibacillus alginolyticus]
MGNGFITSIEHFKPHTFQAEQGEGLYISHSHDYDELTLILDGEGYYSSAEQNIKVSKGDLILIPSQLHHGFVCIKPWRGISVHFIFDRIPAYCQYLFLNAYQKPLHIRISHLHEEHLEWANMSLLQLELEWKTEEKSEYSYDLMRNIFETVLLLYHKNMITPQLLPEKSDDSLIIQEVLREIHRRYNTSITINEIASRHFLSESLLRRKFSEMLGISPKQYIINLRLEEAKRLLQQTDRAIEYISSEVGFTSSSRFYDLFVKMVGMTPMEWRKLNE